MKNYEKSLKAAQDDNYKLRCEMQSYINKADEAIFNENQAHAKLEKLKSEIETLKYDNEQLTTKLAYWENGER